MSGNVGDFQIGVYTDAVKGVNSRYPFDFRSIEGKAAEALPDWVAGQGAGHTFRTPELGHCQGFNRPSPHVQNTGSYAPVHVPLGSCYPEWK